MSLTLSTLTLLHLDKNSTSVPVDHLQDISSAIGDLLQTYLGYLLDRYSQHTSSDCNCCASRTLTEERIHGHLSRSGTCKGKPNTSSPGILYYTFKENSQLDVVTSSLVTRPLSTHAVELFPMLDIAVDLMLDGRSYYRIVLPTP